MRQSCLCVLERTESSGVENFEDSPQDAFVFGDGFHGLDVGEGEGQGRGLVAAEFVDDLLECLQIPCVSECLHPPHRVASESWITCCSLSFLKKRSRK